MNNIIFKGFSPNALKFLTELRENNNRSWFDKNKNRYESDILIPSFDYISSMSKPLAKISTNFNAMPKRIGGSLMRIYRDTRFSKDKTPYKTNIGIQFRHVQAKDVHSPGYYVHIAPDEIFIGIGTWHPPSDALLKIRNHIAENPKKWNSIKNNNQFTSEFEMAGDKLKSVPRGFQNGHELSEDLKWKDFIAVHNLEQKDIQSANFLELSFKLFDAANPYMKFLCEALGVAF